MKRITLLSLAAIAVVGSALSLEFAHASQNRSQQSAHTICCDPIPPVCQPGKDCAPIQDSK